MQAIVGAVRSMDPPPPWLGVLNVIAIVALALCVRDAIRHRLDERWHSLLLAIALSIFVANLLWR